MRVWLITVGEPLPSDRQSVRLLRTGILANLLAEQGHDLLWWSSTFDHQRKMHRYDRDTFLQVTPQFRIALLHSVAYQRNISLARVRNHQGIARKFSRYASAEAPPDVILCSLPTIELSLQAVRYGERVGVPVVIDVRDMWPDIFADLLPSPGRWLGRLALRPLSGEVHLALQQATAIVAMSEGCLRWGLRYAQRSQRPGDGVFPLAYQRPAIPADPSAAAVSLLRQSGVDPTRLLCWFIGSFGKHYDVATVIQAARALAQRGDQRVQFVLSGDGDSRAHLERLAHGLENVVFTGWIDGPQIAAMMSVAAIGLVAVDGIPGTLPNKLFEYFSAGLPVLSSLPGEAAALIEHHDCGLTYAPQDPNDFLKALTALIDDDRRRRRMGANAQRLFDADYSAEVVYPRLAAHLSAVAQASPVAASS